MTWSVIPPCILLLCFVGYCFLVEEDTNDPKGEETKEEEAIVTNSFVGSVRQFPNDRQR